MIIRTSIEYVAPRTIRVTTPFRQKELTVPGNDDTYAIDFRTLNLFPDPHADERVVVYWVEDSKTLYVDDYDSLVVEMPSECSHVVLKAKI